MTIKRNKSTFCVMPILDIPRDELYWDKYYLNCYIGIEEHLDDKNKFCLLFNFNKDLKTYLIVKEILIKCDDYLREITYTSSKNNDYHIFVFNVKTKYHNDISLFKQGKYSKFSTDYKNLILKIHKVTKRKKLYHIIMKTEERRLQLSDEYNHDIPQFVELWTLPKKEEEILTLTKLE